MFHFTKKKTIIGVIGLILSIVLAAVCGGFDKSGSIDQLTAGETAIRFFCVSGIALALSFLVIILFDWKMFFFAFGAMEIMLSIQFITAANVSVGRILISLLVLGLAIFYFTAEYRRSKYDINGAVGVRQQQKEQKLIKDFEQLIAQDSELKRSIQYPEKSIVLASQMGSIFQVIKSDGEYHFHCIGHMFTKIDQSKYITDFESIDNYSDKGDYSVNRADISSVTATLRNVPNMMDFGTVKVSVNGKTKRYGLINVMSAEELKTFFGEDIAITDKNVPAESNETDMDDNRKKVLNKINLARYVFSIISAAIFSAYTFLNSEKTDAVFTAFAIVICLTPVICYFVLKDFVTIRDVNVFTKQDKSKINILFTVMLFPIVFALKCLLLAFSVEHYQLGKLLLYSLIPFAILLVAFLLFSKEYKKFKSCILVFALVMAFFSPSVVCKVNSAFDFRQPDVVACKVVDTSTHTDNSGKVTYYLVFEYGDRTIKTEVEENVYDQTEVGGEVNVLRYHGALGIQSVYLQK